MVLQLLVGANAFNAQSGRGMIFSQPEEMGLWTLLCASRSASIIARPFASPSFAHPIPESPLSRARRLVQKIFK
jgi:hypothetical protein